ncbi:MAG: hypothetical protein IPN33_05090 [Saprospiraceae bacterium]|nr:hypothetical protein [Saprospiraceae bacterium]
MSHHEIHLYNAYSGMNSRERNELVKFLVKNVPSDNRQYIGGAIDYALKVKPSFGGFIITAQDGDNIVAAVIANKTGLEGYGPSYVLAYAVFHPDVASCDMLVQQIFRKVSACADGDISMRLSPRSPALKLFKKIGFKSEYVELRLHNPAHVASPEVQAK